MVAAIAVGLDVMVAPFGRVAAADDKVVLGGGAGIVVEGRYCTLTTIGHDHVGDLVGFTAGHCGGPAAPVVAEGADNHGPVGSVAAVGDGLDYGVIKFDPAKVIPTANVAGFAINGIGADPDWHQDACTLGAATGSACSRISTLPGPGPGRAMRALFQPGDDGGPVTSDGQLIGLALDGLVVPPGEGFRQQLPLTHFVLFSAILNDVNAKSGPGAGFTPI